MSTLINQKKSCITVKIESYKIIHHIWKEV